MARETIIFKSITLKVDQCSETLYSIYFNPQICEAQLETVVWLLEKALEDAAKESNGAISFEARDADCGVVVVRINPMIDTKGYNLAKLFTEMSKIIDAHTGNSQYR